VTGQNGQRALSWLALLPRDTVLIRDGRSFDAAADAMAQTVRPWPSTVAGAIGAAFGAEPGTTPDKGSGAVPDEVRGPVLGHRSGQPWEPYFPVPADLVQEADGENPYAFRLRPTGGQTDLDEAGLRWLMPPRGAGKVRPLQGWMPGRKLTEYLAGGLPPGDPADPGDVGISAAGLECTDPLCPELRVGLAREPGRQARTGFLYQATHWRLKEDWAFLAGCALGDGWDRTVAGPVPFGGRGRMADVTVADGVSWPTMPDEFPGGRVLVYLATPALWPGGWRIPVPEGACLAGAATGGEPEAVATITPGRNWRASRALRWAVPPGSVYLLEFDDQARARGWAAAHHGTAYGREPRDPLRTAGFGVVLMGVWR
jgi:CRISPR type III-B/RAMP module-associated protein Cmr3